MTVPNVTNIDKLSTVAPGKGVEKSDISDNKEFQKALNESLENDKSAEIKPALPRTVEFSAHAVERMTQRGIHFTPEQMTKLEEAVNKASNKGSKEALILTENAAAIVNVKESKIVTVMDRASLSDKVFTNIDSTVVI